MQVHIYNMAIPLKLLAVWKLAQLGIELLLGLYIIAYRPIICHSHSDYVTRCRITAHVLNQALLPMCVVFYEWLEH